MPAVMAWTVGAVFGLLTVNTTLYIGPLADIAGGVDLSTMGQRSCGIDLRGIAAFHQTMTRSP